MELEGVHRGKNILIIDHCQQTLYGNEVTDPSYEKGVAVANKRKTLFKEIEGPGMPIPLKESTEEERKGGSLPSQP